MDSVVSGVQVLDRAVAVLDAVANSGASSLADLVEDTTLARPTAYRLAIALEQHGLLARDEDGRFVLGGRLRSWGSLAARGLPVAAQPVLAELAATTGESAQLYVRQGDRRVCVAVHERATGLRDTVPLGAVMPLARGSGGKVLLAWSDDATGHGIPAAELAAIRRRGWADSVGEREPGVASVSAPVRDSDGRVVAAISVSGPIGRLGEHPGRRLARSVASAAERLGRVIAE
ncbi:MAG TPA: IclR family transcriptional regulator [Acidimicrobiia bacterium]|jgi:DNA-binding IclR family transcriptional regulator|nr:IclR family transcriptional regulator [Acidimicrobiia bacterium]